MQGDPIPAYPGLRCSTYCPVYIPIKSFLCENYNKYFTFSIISYFAHKRHQKALMDYYFSHASG